MHIQKKVFLILRITTYFKHKSFENFARISDISYIPNALAVKLNTLLKLEKLTKQIKSVAVIEHYLGTIFADKSACWVLISELNLEVPFHYKIVCTLKSYDRKNVN